MSYLWSLKDVFKVFVLIFCSVTDFLFDFGQMA